MSRAALILAENFRLLIGEGKTYKNESDMGKKTGIGQRQVNRIMNAETDPKLSNLESYSDRLRCPLPALLSPDFDIIKGSASPEVAEILRRIAFLDRKGILQEHDLLHLSTSVQLIENSKASVTFTDHRENRGTGT